MQQSCFFNFHGTDIFWNYLLINIGDIYWYFVVRPVSIYPLLWLEFTTLCPFCDRSWDFLPSSPSGLFPLFLLSLAAYVLAFSVGFFQSLVDLFFSWSYPISICRKKGWFSCPALVLLFDYLFCCFVYENIYMCTYVKTYFSACLYSNDFFFLYFVDYINRFCVCICKLNYSATKKRIPTSDYYWVWFLAKTNELF